MNLQLVIEDQRYNTDDWSLGGFRVDAFHRDVHLGEKLTGSVATWGGLRHDPFEADVLRLTPTGGVSCRFLTLPKSVVRKFIA